MLNDKKEPLWIEAADLDKTNLFQQPEIRNSIVKIKWFEKIYDPESELEKWYKDYIHYLLCIYKVARKVRGKKKTSPALCAFQSKIRGKIRSLNESFLKKYDDLEGYLEFYRVCREANIADVSHEILDTMLRVHKNSEKAWLTAASWYKHEKKDVNCAIMVLKVGLSFNYGKRRIYSEIIRYELKKMNLKYNEKFPRKKYLKLNNKLREYFASMLKCIHEYDHYIDILCILDNYDCTIPTQKKILRYLFTNHSDKPMLWNYMANRERKIIKYPIEGCEVKKTRRMRVLACIAKFEQGLTKVPEANKTKLWDIYLKCVVDIRNKEFSNAVHERKRIILDTFRSCAARSPLPEECYLCWLDLEDEKKQPDIIKLANEQYPESVALWKLRLQYAIRGNNHTDIMNVFRESLQNVWQVSRDLWIVMMNYMLTRANNDEIERFYKEALRQPHTISHTFKPMYITWLAFTRGIEACRAEYFSLAEEKPHCHELYTSMINLESVPMMQNSDAWEKVQLLACKQFGRDDLEIWMRYLNFYMYNRRNTKLEDFHEVLRRAKETMKPHLYARFERSYDALMAHCKAIKCEV